MRKKISFIFAALFLCVGLYVLYLQAFEAHVISLRLLMAAAMFIAIAVWFLWDDFLPKSKEQK